MNWIHRLVCERSAAALEEENGGGAAQKRACAHVTLISIPLIITSLNAWW